MANNNVVQLPKVELPGLGMAATASKGVRLPGAREIWLCAAYEPSGRPVVVMVRPGNTVQEMFTEVLAAQLGQCFRLPCPTPYLVTVRPEHIGRPAGPVLIVLGSRDESSRSLARQVTDPETMVDLLQRYDLTETTLAFDEWIAASARGPEQFLFDPDNGPMFMAHPGAMRAAPGQDNPNQFAAAVLARLDKRERPALLAAVRARGAAAHRIRLKHAPEAAEYVQDGVQVYAALLDYIVERLAHLDRLLSTRILPEQGYLIPAPDDDDARRTTHL